METKQFKSPSGNLRCELGVFAGLTGAICELQKVNFAVPSSACTAGPAGVYVGVSELDAYWPCASAEITPADTLALDTPYTYAGVTCSINQTTGVTCKNSAGRGFTMEYDQGVQTF